MTKKTLKRIKWTARISSLIIFILGFPFYIGYGNPLPFSNPDYSLWDNVWLSIFFFMFLGLIAGWRWEKIAGFLIVVPILIGFIFSLIIWEDPSFVMVIPLIIGVLYLIYGYKKQN